MKDKLKIIAVDENIRSNGSPTSTKTRRQELQAKFDRQWLENPRQFDPERNCIEKERLKRTWELLLKHTSIKGKRAVDLGCGGGVFAQMLAAAGASVDAVDISSNALKVVTKYESDKITTVQDMMPNTRLDDDSYDIVISTELLGYLPRGERRLYFAELSRLVKADGFVISSTSFDIDTEDALQTFWALVETEFHPIEWVFSHHTFFIRVKNFLKIPSKFANGYQDESYREKQVKSRTSVSKWWYKINSSKVLGPIWNIVQMASVPVLNIFKNKRSIMLRFEKICRFFCSESGISHAVFIGQRRPFEVPTKEEIVAVEPKQKRQVWE